MSQICVVCNTRKAWHLGNKACRACRTRTAVEGTRSQYGLPETTKVTQRRVAYVKQYNSLVAQGLDQAQIVAAMGRSLQAVKNKNARLRKEGYKIDRSQGRQGLRKLPSEPVDRTGRSPSINEHGGGKHGITGCGCESCMAVRRHTRREWAKANPEKIQASNRKYSQKRKPS